MKLSKTLLQAITIAVAIGTTTSCGKSVDAKPKKDAAQKNAKSDSTYVIPDGCPACGMG